MRRILVTLTKPFLGRQALQPLFEQLHIFSLGGMNAGRGSDVVNSGERRVIEALAGRKNPPLVFDVGANRGGYAELVLSVCPAATIYSFEPSSAAFEVLEGLTQPVPRWKAFNLALGAIDAEATLFSDNPGSELASLYARDPVGTGPLLPHSESVKVESLDGFCSKHPVAFIDLLKLDAEGHEFRILEGARGLLDSKKIGIIQFEFGGRNLDSRTFLRDFFGLLAPQYRIFRIVKDGLRPVEYNERWEIFTTTNFLAAPAPRGTGTP